MLVLAIGRDLLKWLGSAGRASTMGSQPRYNNKDMKYHKFYYGFMASNTEKEKEKENKELPINSLP